MNGASSLGQAGPPWQLWGNTQVVEVQGSAFTAPNAGDNNQTMIRIAYGRPESWRFLLAYKLLEAPPSPLNQSNISVWFELITGHGRAAVRLPFWSILPSTNWSGGNPPLNVMTFSTRAQDDKNSIITLDNGGTPITGTASLHSDHVVGQDITVKAIVSFTTNLPLPQRAKVEVSAMFAPAAGHVRPDWFRLDAPLAEQFTGGEVGAR